MELAELPDTFSQFRKQVEKTEQPDHTLRIRTVSALPPPPGFPEDNRGQCPPIPEPIHRSPFTGGEEAGLAQLQAFVFEQHRIADYKETRNALDDWGSSSKFSPWLANGCLSVREVAAGVGADPRGLRQFNLDKQAQQYDPDGAFVDRWQGEAQQPVGLHTVDAADWPLS